MFKIKTLFKHFILRLKRKGGEKILKLLKSVTKKIPSPQKIQKLLQSASGITKYDKVY